MTTKRNKAWEEKEDIIKAYTVNNSIYYIVRHNDTYNLQFWPDKEKKIETVSILDTYSEKSKAIKELDKKVS